MEEKAVLTRKELKIRIENDLIKQGFFYNNGILSPPENKNKEDIRNRHRQAVDHKIEDASKSLAKYENRLLSRIANGNEVNPQKIQPLIIEVQSGSEDELLFRYATLHWSIPISSGYGRRLRFLVIDEFNEKLIGIIGLGDPVFGLKARDQWIGWDHEQRRERLRNVLDAFVLGAVPPYSMLLCGKLVALLAASDEIRFAFRRKYAKLPSIISDIPGDGRLALITTTSALGRSSIYNRLRYQNEQVFLSVGNTSMWGEIFFSNGLYAPLYAYAEANLEPTAKQKSWGTGFRNRREIVQKCLKDIGLSQTILQHRIEREIFVVPLAKNTQAFLRGDHQRLYPYNRSLSDIFIWFRERWLLPRVTRDDGYKNFNANDWKLWNNN